MSPVYATCPACGITTVGRSRHRTAQQWAQLRDDGILPRRGGLCRRCYYRADRRAYPLEAEDAAERRVPRDVLLDEWPMLADPRLSIAENCRRIAPRLGMRWRSLERAVLRAGIARRAA